MGDLIFLEGAAMNKVRIVQRPSQLAFYRQMLSKGPRNNKDFWDSVIADGPYI